MLRHPGDCDTCRQKDCKLSDGYIKQLAQAIVEGKKIILCKKWR